jgi:hypothetical protein
MDRNSRPGMDSRVRIQVHRHALVSLDVIDELAIAGADLKYAGVSRDVPPKPVLTEYSPDGVSPIQNVP